MSRIPLFLRSPKLFEILLHKLQELLCECFHMVSSVQNDWDRGPADGRDSWLERESRHHLLNDFVVKGNSSRSDEGICARASHTLSPLPLQAHDRSEQDSG
jgi:hypothetical protein